MNSKILYFVITVISVSVFFVYLSDSSETIEYTSVNKTAVNPISKDEAKNEALTNKTVDTASVDELLTNNSDGDGVVKLSITEKVMISLNEQDFFPPENFMSGSDEILLETPVGEEEFITLMESQLGSDVPNNVESVIYTEIGDDFLVPAIIDKSSLVMPEPISDEEFYLMVSDTVSPLLSKNEVEYTVIQDNEGPSMDSQ